MGRLILAISEMAEGEKVDRYVRGLQSRLYKEVMVKDPATFDDPVVIATRYEALLRTPERTTASYTQATSAVAHSEDPMDLDAVWQSSQQPRLRQKGQNDRNRQPTNNMRQHNIHCFSMWTTRSHSC